MKNDIFRKKIEWAFVEKMIFDLKAYYQTWSGMNTLKGLNLYSKSFPHAKYGVSVCGNGKKFRPIRYNIWSRTFDRLYYSYVYMDMQANRVIYNLADYLIIVFANLTIMIQVLTE